MPPHLLAALFFLLQTAAGRPVDGFYLGTLTSGARTLEVALTLKTEGDGLTGTYHYFGPSREPIALQGTLGADRTIRLSEKGVTDGRVTGRWAGRVDGHDLVGTWTSARGARQWAFRLTRAEQAAAWFEGGARTMDTASGPITFRTARVPQSEHRVPLITAFGNPAVMSEVNATLMGAANAAHCENPEDDDFSFEAEIGLAAAHVLSVNIRESWFCKAAYPTTGADSSLVFDLRDGRTIQLDDLFRKDLAPGRLAAVLFPYELSRTRDRGTAKASEGEGNECTDVWAEELAEANLGVHFRLVGDGLVVRLDLPHVVAACANDVTVPFAALASIAAPDGPLAPLVAAHRGKPVIYRIHEPAMAPGENFPYTPPAR